MGTPEVKEQQGEVKVRYGDGMDRRERCGEEERKRGCESNGMHEGEVRGSVEWSGSGRVCCG